MSKGKTMNNKIQIIQSDFSALKLMEFNTEAYSKDEIFYLNVLTRYYEGDISGLESIIDNTSNKYL